MKQIPKIHDVVAVSSGRYAGLSGVVTETKEGGARVKIEGVRDNEPVTAHVWQKNSSLSVIV